VVPCQEAGDTDALALLLAYALVFLITGREPFGKQEYQKARTNGRGR
jgi:hypothetical protein